VRGAGSPDRHVGEIPDPPHREIPGQRDCDRALQGSNLMHDLPALGLLDDGSVVNLDEAVAITPRHGPRADSLAVK